MFLSLAKKLCSKSGHRQHHHASIIVSGGAVMAIATNTGIKHAEVQALSKLWPSERKGVVVYSLRFRKGGTFGMAKPCSKCEQYLRDNGVKQVFYTDVNGDLTKMRLR